MQPLSAPVCQSQMLEPASTHPRTAPLLNGTARRLDRRAWLVRAALAAAPVVLGPGALTALGMLPTPAHAGMGLNGYTVSTAEITALLGERFPKTLPLAGLADLTLERPALAMHPDVNRMSARLPLEISGPMVAKPGHGALALAFGLRYEPSDRTLRAHDIALESLQVEGLDAGAAALLHAWAPRLAQRSFKEVVVHRLQPKDLALLDGLGMQPGAITVTPQGLSVAFEKQKL